MHIPIGRPKSNTPSCLVKNVNDSVAAAVNCFMSIDAPEFLRVDGIARVAKIDQWSLLHNHPSDEDLKVDMGHSYLAMNLILSGGAYLVTNRGLTKLGNSIR